MTCQAKGLADVLSGRVIVVPAGHEFATATALCAKDFSGTVPVTVNSELLA